MPSSGILPTPVLSAEEASVMSPLTYGICSECGKLCILKPDKKDEDKKDPTLRYPKAWLKLRDGVWVCTKCKEAGYTTNNFTYRVVTSLSMPWFEFTPLLSEQAMWFTYAANALIMRLYAEDEHPTPESPFLSEFKVKFNAYKFVRSAAPSIASSACSVLSSQVVSHYKKRRFDMAWNGHSVPRYRYPHPVVIRAGDVKLRMAVDPNSKRDYPVLTVRFGDRWVDLRLDAGKWNERNLEVFRQAAEGRHKVGNAQFLIETCSQGSHRHAILSRDKDTGNKVVLKIKVMIAITRAVPPVNKEKQPETMFVRTDPNSFLLCSTHGSWIHRFNGDKVRQRVAAEELRKAAEGVAAEPVATEAVRTMLIRRDHHFGRMRRLADDKKFLRRRGPDRGIAGLSKRVSYTHAVWTRGWLHQLVAKIVDLAIRKKAGHICLDTTCRRFCPKFQWFQLTDMLAAACRKAGLKFTDVTLKAVVDSEAKQARKTAKTKGEAPVYSDSQKEAQRERLAKVVRTHRKSEAQIKAADERTARARFAEVIQNTEAVGALKRGTP